MKNSLFKLSIQDMCEIAILSALAVVFDRFVKIPLGATGGSINIALVPIFIIGLRHGWFKCFIAGAIIFGLSTCLLDGWGLMYYPLEYFVAFGAVCFVGLFARFIFKQYQASKKGVVIAILTVVLSCLIWFVIRLAAGVTDTLIFYEGYTVWTAVAYHVPYMIISATADAILVSILLPVIVRLNKQFPTSFTKSLNE